MGFCGSVTMVYYCLIGVTSDGFPGCARCPSRGLAPCVIHTMLYLLTASCYTLCCRVGVLYVLYVVVGCGLSRARACEYTTYAGHVRSFTCNHL